MIGFIKKYLEPLRGEAEGKLQADREERLNIAVCVLLLEVAASDYHFTPQEEETLTQILQEQFHIPGEEIKEIMSTAQDHRANSVDLWEYTHLINKNYSLEEKKKLVEMFWKIIYADGKLDQYEDYMVHKLADLLLLSHDDLIAAKLKQKPGDYSGR